MPEVYNQPKPTTLPPAKPSAVINPPLDSKPNKTKYTLHNFKVMDYFWISLLWFGITFLWGGMNAVILPHLNEKYAPENWKGTALGVITAVGMIVAIIVQPAAGALSDFSRHAWGRRRPFIFVGGVLTVLSLIITTTMVVFFGNWWMLMLCYIFIQLADNILQGAYQGIIPDVVPPRKRGKASGAMGIAQTLGNVAGLAAATAFIDNGHTELGLLAISLVFGLSVIVTLVKVKEEPLPPDTEKPDQAKIMFGTIFEVWRHLNFRLFILSRLMVMTGLAVITIFALYYLKDVFGQKEGTLTESYTILGLAVVVASILSVFPAVWLSDRFGRKPIVILSCFIGAFGMGLMITATTMWQVIAYGCVVGLSLGSFNTLNWAFGIDIVPHDAAGRYMGVSNLAGAGSQALAAFLGGALLDGFNALGVTYFGVKNMGYTALFVMAMLFFLFGAYFLKLINEPKPE
jgi:MFS family permease